MSSLPLHYGNRHPYKKSFLITCLVIVLHLNPVPHLSGLTDITAVAIGGIIGVLVEDMVVLGAVVCLGMDLPLFSILEVETGRHLFLFL